MSSPRILIRRGKSGTEMDGLVCYKHGKPWGYAVLQKRVLIARDDVAALEWRDLPLTFEDDQPIGGGT